MNRHKTNTPVRGKPLTYHNRSGGHQGQKYTPPPMRGNNRSHLGPPPGFSHKDRKRSNNSTIMSSKSPTFIPESGRYEPLKMEKETLKRLLDTFNMTPQYTGRQYRSPDGCSDVRVDRHGTMEFLITDTERYDIGTPLLLETLSRIHRICMVMRLRSQRSSRTDKSHIISRCLSVDPFEVSWSIQTYLFKMHKRGIRFLVTGLNNTLCIDKNVLLKMVRDSLTNTCMTRENAYWAFNTIATDIINEL